MVWLEKLRIRKTKIRKRGRLNMTISKKYLLLLLVIPLIFASQAIASDEYEILSDPVGGVGEGLLTPIALCANLSIVSNAVAVVDPVFRGWDCEAGGLLHFPGNVILQLSLSIVDFDAGTEIIGGTIHGEQLFGVFPPVCQNVTNGSFAVSDLHEPTGAWNCTSAGLVANPGDVIFMLTFGITP
jgi:hypothetical protein